MKMRVYLSLGALLLFLTRWAVPARPKILHRKHRPKNSPNGPEEPKPEFVDANRSMEETMHLEDDE